MAKRGPPEGELGGNYTNKYWIPDPFSTGIPPRFIYSEKYSHMENKAFFKNKKAVLAAIIQGLSSKNPVIIHCLSGFALDNEWMFWLELSTRLDNFWLFGGSKDSYPKPSKPPFGLGLRIGHIMPLVLIFIYFDLKRYRLIRIGVFQFTPHGVLGFSLTYSIGKETGSACSPSPPRLR